MKYDGIIFDLDGTLWSSVDVVEQVWREFAAVECPEAVINKEVMQSIMGMRIDAIGKKIFHMCTDARREELMMTLCHVECGELARRGGKIFPQLHETLAQLKKTHPLFIVSNCHDGYIESFMEAHNTKEFFTDYEWDHTGRDKGGNILMLMERNGLKNPVYVGDTQGDANAARKAGIPFIYAKYGFGQVDAFDAEIECFADLLKLEL